MLLKKHKDRNQQNESTENGAHYIAVDSRFSVKKRQDILKVKQYPK